MSGRPSAAVIEHWRQGWLPGEDVAHLDLQRGPERQAAVPLEGGHRRQDRPLRDHAAARRRRADVALVRGRRRRRLLVHLRAGAGPRVAGYRQITGTAPMMPRWAFGLWQCRERYKTAAESVAVLDEYRKRGIPVDVIVQDWQYWRPSEWGSHSFDPARFPDPARWVADLHDRHARVMISVWPKFYPRHGQLQGAGGGRRALPGEPRRGQAGLARRTSSPTTTPSARRRARSTGRRSGTRCSAKGIDAWWMDVSELEAVEGPFPTPAAQVEAYQTHMNPTGARLGRARAQRLPAGARPGRVRGAARGGARPARPDPDPQRLRGHAALRGGVVVGRHLVDLDGDAQAARRRARVRAVGHALLDVRHRRLLGARTLRARAARFGRAARSGASWRRAGSSSRRSSRSCACTARRRSARCGSSAATTARPTRRS